MLRSEIPGSLWYTSFQIRGVNKHMGEKKTSLLYKIIRFLVWLFSPKMKIHGAEKLPEEPVVIVGNHSQMSGPITAELYLPGRHDTWCAGEMMHLKEVPAYAYKDFWSFKPRAQRWFFRALSYVIAPLAVCVFNNANTIPVYHDARLISTYRKSIEGLRAGRSMVIFPECNRRRSNILYDFQDKFVDLARFYYKKTGEKLCFVPLYIAPRLKSAYFGEPLRFDPDAPTAAERERICIGLADRITELAVSLPEHTVVPYRNIRKKDYPHNIPFEVYRDETPYS